MSVVKETYNRLRITIPPFMQGEIKIEQTEERLEEEEQERREERREREER